MASLAGVRKTPPCEPLAPPLQGGARRAGPVPSRRPCTQTKAPKVRRRRARFRAARRAWYHGAAGGHWIGGRRIVRRAAGCDAYVYRLLKKRGSAEVTNK